MDASAAAQAMADWYQATRARDAAPLETGSDVLTVQWGTRARSGVLRFEYEISRRMTVRRAAGGYVWQLSLNYSYEATELTAALGADRRRCILPDRAVGFQDHDERIDRVHERLGERTVFVGGVHGGWSAAVVSNASTLRADRPRPAPRRAVGAEEEETSIGPAGYPGGRCQCSCSAAVRDRSACG